MVQKIYMPKKERIWGHFVRFGMVLWHLESRPQVRLTINGGQFVPLEMILWHSKAISAAVDQALKPILNTSRQVKNALHLGFILKCNWELNWGQNCKPFEFFAKFNYNLKIILRFRSDKPVLGGNDPKIKCSKSINAIKAPKFTQVPPIAAT